MKPYFETERGTLYCGDCMDTLSNLPEKFINCCVTSPPYWGLRDYGTALWVGGDPGCDHGVKLWEGKKQTQGAQSGKASKADKLNRAICYKCGAKRVDKQLGLEKTPEEYVKGMVDVFRGVWRVLRDDGVLWLNLGDSYVGGGRAGKNPEYHKKHKMFGKSGQHPSVLSKPQKVPVNLKPKDLVGIPWRVALALQADGWYLRQDIIWSKNNPMPESVTDRCTKSHEYIFLLSKSERYFYDHEAVKEPVADSTVGRGPVSFGGKKGREYNPESTDPNFRNGNEQWGRTFDYKESCKTGRNKRSVWTVPTKPLKEAHFACFPPALITPCVLAGCPKDGTVLDPFNGAGTSWLVAEKQFKNYVGIELNPEYCEITKKRIKQATAQLDLFEDTKVSINS